MLSDATTVYIDGGSRGNPGTAGCGIVLVPPGLDSQPQEYGFYLGEDRTNNYAEYGALIIALHICMVRGLEHIDIFSDSELLVKQIKGEYKVKADTIKPLYARVVSILNGPYKFRWSIGHIPRESNNVADTCANIAMDAAASGLPFIDPFLLCKYDVATYVMDNYNACKACTTLPDQNLQTALLLGDTKSDDLLMRKAANMINQLLWYADDSLPDDKRLEALELQVQLLRR